jgi:hypothetical protein
MKRLLLLGTAVLLVLTACGGSHKSAVLLGPIPASAPVRSVHAIANARRREALREARKLLGRVVLPSGAIRLRRLPRDAHGGDDVLGHSWLGVSVSTKFAETHAFWRVGLPLSRVVRFLTAHATAGLRWGSSARDGGPGPPNEIEAFYGRLVGGRPVQRLLSFAVVRLAGRTVIRVDAAAAWIYPRSPREVVPAGVREVDIEGGGVSRKVRDSASVARIIRWFDALNVVQPGQGRVGCRIGAPYHVPFVFRSSTGAKLASAIVPSEPADGCDAITFKIGGTQQTALIDATPGGHKAFVDRVQRLLGLRFKTVR